MATSPIQNSAALEALSRSLLRAADQNNDGALSADEFSSFLAKLLERGTADIRLTGDGNVGGGTIGGTGGTTGGGRLASPVASMEGFDARKIADPNKKSAKYLFARVAQYYDVSSVRTKADAESLLNSMRQDLEAGGLTVLGVDKDKIQVRDDSGRAVWIDVIRGTTSGSPSFQWLDTRS